MFIYFWERETQSEWETESLRGLQALSCQDRALCRIQPHEGWDQTWVKVGRPTNWATQVPQKWKCFKENKNSQQRWGGTWVAQVLEPPTLDFGSCFVSSEFEPHIGLCADNSEPAWDSLSLPLLLSSLSLLNKHLNR